MEDNKRRSDRGSRGDKDEKHLKDPMEDKKVDASSVARKRSSSASEDEMLNSNSKKSKHGAALEYDERKDEDHIEDDRRDLDSAGSKSEKRSLGNEADQGIQEAQLVVHETDMSSAEFSLPAPRLEDPFPAQLDKEDSCSTVADLNGKHEPGVDGAFVGTEESAI
ncbi:hypothetical protein E2562_038180 [Oryza meyeriana var. granulata]|uniref:Uncharacterized protein n=1 Tax=Oryza meyeriana var. granulata TaxID=110450 RepID=A0A6G1CLY3_9ORYZ|nr:hypothetical protein E2562_038180 [Oryza meyeriana var. granulata]